ncbi:MAG: OFA family MFS transporter [Bacillota bacterium]|jgi:OFA family oxalate/formate antiporter-like MFS transporter
MHTIIPKQPNRNVILIASVIIMLCLGIIYMWSIFSKYVCAYYGWELHQVSLTSSIMFGAFVIGIISGGKIQHPLGMKKTIMIGTLLFSGGIFLTSFLSSTYPWMLYITYGVIAGFGVGIAYACALACCQAWFPDKRGFASGITISAFGLSVVIFSPIAEALLTTNSPPTTFRIFAITFFIICFVSSLFIKEKIQKKEEYDGCEVIGGIKQYKPNDIIKNKYFYQIMLILLCSAAAYLVLIPILRPLGELRGLSSNLAIFSVMLAGICSCIGRFVLGFLSDEIGRKYALAVTSIITIISTLLLIKATGMTFLATTAAIAFSYGGVTALMPPITGDYFGIKYVAANTGCVMIGSGFSAIFFPILINSIQQGNSNYTFSLIIPAVTGGIALLLISLLKKDKKNI